MNLRRARILREARGMLVHAGYDGLNLRSLAKAAEVTVPTLYNLVGNKEEIVAALFAEALAEVEQRMAQHRGTEPLELAEAVVMESVGLFGEDEDFYRAAFIAVEYLNQSPQHHHTVARLYEWGEQLVSAGCVACAKAGLLRGRVPVTLLGQHILRDYRASCRDWAFKRLSIAEFQAQALSDIYLTLAADAVETFQAALAKKISRCVAAPSGRKPTRATCAKRV